MSICVENNQLSAAVQCVLIIVSYCFFFVCDCQCMPSLAFSVELFSFSYMTVSSFSILVHLISFSILIALFTKFESANGSMRSWSDVG